MPYNEIQPTTGLDSRVVLKPPVSLRSPGVIDI